MTCQPAVSRRRSMVERRKIKGQPFMDSERADVSNLRAVATASFIADLKATGARQRHAFALLYRDYAPRLTAYYLGQGADRTLADDWVQDTFMRVMRGISSLENEAAFAGWLWAIARHVMIDARRRKHSGFASLDETDEGGLALWESIVCARNGPAEALEQQQHTALVNRQFAAFRRDFPERAQCIAWTCRDDMSMSDIAAAIGRSVGATREYISQCRKKARSYFLPCIEAVSG